MGDVDLDLWLRGVHVASTRSSERGRKVRIVYNESIMDRYEPETPLLSCSLPTPGPSTPANARAFLEGLLPEGRALESAAAQVAGVQLVDGAPGSAHGAVTLLGEFGRDCAGAVVAVPAGSEPPRSGRYEPLDETQLGAALRELPRHPLGSDLAREIRMSLAGAQPKMLLARLGGTWHTPVDGAPSTHIIKPVGDWADSARNEALVLRLAQDCGLTECESWVESMDGIEVFVTERFDRTTNDGRIERLHQEDMCQALGMRPRDKYQIGRPSERMARVLRTHADDPRSQIAELFRQVAFRAIVGDEDGHGKNYSIILEEGRVRLAPLYDSVCTLAYPALSGKMAAPIGAQVRLSKVDRSALLDEGTAMSLTRVEVTNILAALAESMTRSIANLGASHLDGWASHVVTEIILRRIARLQDGSPLGLGT